MRTPSHFFPDTSNGIFQVIAIHFAGVFIPINLLMLVPSTLPWVISGLAIAVFDLVATVSLVAIYRHYRYVRPYLREAAHHCPECDYEIGEDRMEQGCPECGWQCEPH